MGEERFTCCLENATLRQQEGCSSNDAPGTHSGQQTGNLPSTGQQPTYCSTPAPQATLCPRPFVAYACTRLPPCLRQ